MAKKKMSKTIDYDNQVVVIDVTDGSKGAVTYSFDSLPEEVRSKLGPFGLGHKLGDAAAGKDGVEAEESIARVFEGLMNGDWSVRAPAGPKISTAAIASNFENLSEEEKAGAKAVLASLGIKIPGITVDDDSEE